MYWFSHRFQYYFLRNCWNSGGEKIVCWIQFKSATLVCNFLSTDAKFFYHIGRNPIITASSAILVLITILPEIWFEQTAVLIEAVGITFSRDAGLLWNGSASQNRLEGQLIRIPGERLFSCRDWHRATPYHGLTILGRGLLVSPWDWV